MRRYGFTLVELLIVVVILGILATVVFPMFTEAATNAKSATLKSHLKGIRSAMQRYKIDHGEFPPAGSAEDTLTYPTDQRGKREGESGYSGTTVGGPYLRGTRVKITSKEEVLVLPNNPFWAHPTADPKLRTFWSGTCSSAAVPRFLYNSGERGYITPLPMSLPKPEVGPEHFHAAWGPQDSDCGFESEDPDCTFNW